MGERVELTVNLPAEVVGELEQLAREKGVSVAAALRHSIRVNKFLNDQIAQRKQVVLERPDGRFERVNLGS